jgi:phosphoglycolate phosphatase
MQLYADNLCNRSHLFAGVRDGLDYLKAAGYKVGCITNKPAQFTDPLLRQLGVYDEFDIVISGDTLPRKKPDPMPLLHAAARFGIDPHDALMVGDSISDVTAARAAGFHIVCVNYGYNHGHDVADAHPDAVIATLAHLQSLLERAA